MKNDQEGMRGGRWLENLVQDIRYGARQLRRNPGFAAAAVLTLALGIGANTAIFSVVRAVLLKPLPYDHPERIMMVWADNPRFNLGFHELPPSQQDILDWRAQARSFEEIAGVSSSVQDLAGENGSRRLGGVSVTANFFATLGARPALGRGFSREEEQPGKDKVAIIGHDLWMNEFGGDPGVIGRSITLNNEKREVIGVMPVGFNFPRAAEMPPPYNLPVSTELWLPVAKDTKFWQDDVNRQFIVIGRLRNGASLAQAQAELSVISERAGRERPATHSGWSAFVRPLARQVAGGARPALFALSGAVAIVLMIACANVANLLLGRSVARRKEMAIRAAIGAGRARVIRQLLTESVLLAMAGGAVGLLLGAGGLRAILAMSPADIPRLREAGFDVTVFLFSATVSILTGLLFGLLPAWNLSQVSLGEAMNASGRSNSAAGGARSFGNLVTAQVAVAVVLLVGAALVLQSFQRLLAVDPGFAKAGVRAFDITFRGVRYDAGASRVAFFQQTRERLKALPGVTEVAAVSHLPLGGSENVGYFVVDGLPKPAAGQEPLAEHRVVTEGYFKTMSVGLLQGRDFNELDGTGKPLVAIVNETLARQFFPGGKALGGRLKPDQTGDKDWLTIVGVVRDVRGTAFEIKPRPGIYRPQAQDPGYWDEMTMVMRCARGGPASSFEAALRREMKAIDPAMPVASFRTMEYLVSTALARPRFSALLLALFASTALVLTLVGIYGVVAHTVGQRTRELGIRLALGAQRRALIRLVVTQGMRPALVGLVLGVGAALGLTRYFAAQLFEVKPADPATFAGVAATLVMVTFLACWLPARRAARVDPMVALRTE